MIRGFSSSCNLTAVHSDVLKASDACLRGVVCIVRECAAAGVLSRLLQMQPAVAYGLCAGSYSANIVSKAAANRSCRQCITAHISAMLWHAFVLSMAGNCHSQPCSHSCRAQNIVAAARDLPAATTQKVATVQEAALCRPGANIYDQFTG